MAIKRRAEAIAIHLGLAAEDLDYYRYQYGHTSQAVWAIGDGYYCVTKGSQKPPKRRDDSTWNWKEVPDAYVNESGWKIWEAISE